MRVVAAVAAVGLSVAAFVVEGAGWEACVDTAAFLVLAAITVTDLEQRIIPNRIVLPAAAAALAVQTIRDPSPEWALAAAGAGGFYFLMALVYPAGLGLGDVKLALFLGAWLGRDVGIGLFIGSLVALLPAIVILARHGTAGRKMGIPFGPFLAVGAVCANFFGKAILDAWLG
jgi:leader peptidase (prepilin peptidase)/N-methyltransferase